VIVIFLRVASYAFRRQAAYRAAAASGVLTNTVFGVVRAYVLIALWQARPSLGGYHVADAVAYCFLTQALIGPVNIFAGGLDLVERIRTGDVAIDLHRPVDLQAWWLADDLGRAAFALLFRGGAPLLFGVFAFRLPVPAPLVWLEFLLSVLLAVLVSFGLRYLVTLLVFWLHDDRGIRSVAFIASMFFSGMVLPLVVFPGWLGGLSRVLPWAALIQVPADVFLGKGPNLLDAYALQVAWALTLIGGGRLLTRATRRKLVIHGG
jgi:ABC-2 type transport system permease protein